MTTFNPADIAKMSPEQLRAALQSMAEENARIMAERASRISFKVSQKGAISVYGLGRLPVTLYPTGWDMLLGTAATLEVFIDKNRSDAEKQSKLYETLEDEATAKGLKDKAASRYVVEKLLEMKNPYTSAEALKYLT